MFESTLARACGGVRRESRLYRNRAVDSTQSAAERVANMPGRLQGKVALVTGGSSGIGEATAKLFAREGAKVVIADVQLEKGQQVASAIQAEGGEASFVRSDVSRDADAKHMVDFTVARYGRLDVLFNNAGVESPKPVVETSEAEWDKVMAVNAKGVFLGTKHAVGAMRKSGGGSIINTSSIFGLIGSPGFAAYHASKGAVRLLTKSTALAHAKENIRANSIHPGVIETPMLREVIEAEPDPEAAKAEWMKGEPIGRFGRPEDIAYGALYLASDESSFVTGAELVIDGGWTAQ
jgi:NAD(P)-dependent dehydrogenase (short-subunit alcohol dehydrogenase family)